MSSELIRKKAREIGYALIRVSYFVRRNDLRQRMEKIAFEFLESAAAASVDTNPKDRVVFDRLFRNIACFDVLVRTGHSLYEIEPVNATILVRELDAFEKAMRQWLNRASVESTDSANVSLPDLESLFSAPLILVENKSFKKEVKIDRPVIRQEKKEVKLFVPKNDLAKKVLNENNKNEASLPDRQNTVFQKIKQFGNPLTGGSARLKDLLAAFPDVSERTLRYDLQRLCEQGMIERVGSGGPASFYRVKQAGLPATVSAVTDVIKR